MAKRLHFQVVDSRGCVHIRTSNSRIYTHCVVVHLGPFPASSVLPDSYTETEWASRVELAERNAARWRTLAARRIGSAVRQIESVEVLEAKRVP